MMCVGRFSLAFYVVLQALVLGSLVTQFAERIMVVSG